jgi:hypothetical protein
MFGFVTETRVALLLLLLIHHQCLFLTKARLSLSLRCERQKKLINPGVMPYRRECLIIWYILKSWEAFFSNKIVT